MPIPIPTFAPAVKAPVRAFAYTVSDVPVFGVEEVCGVDELVVSERGVQYPFQMSDPLLDELKGLLRVFG